MLLERDHTLQSMLEAEVTLPSAVEDSQARDDTSINLTPLDPSAVMLLSILECLYAEHSQGRAHMPLAALCKRLELRMSTLQRLLTALDEQALVKVCAQKDRLVASLTATGAEVALALQTA